MCGARVSSAARNSSEQRLQLLTVSTVWACTLWLMQRTARWKLSSVSSLVCCTRSMADFQMKGRQLGCAWTICKASKVLLAVGFSRLGTGFNRP